MTTLSNHHLLAFDVPSACRRVLTPKSSPAIHRLLTNAPLPCRHHYPLPESPKAYLPAVATSSIGQHSEIRDQSPEIRDQSFVG